MTDKGTLEHRKGSWFGFRFCVAKALTELGKKGVFTVALMKKLQYWPKKVDSDMIRAHFDGAPVCHMDCYRMNLPDDNSQLDIHCLKQPDYVIMLMTTFATTQRVGGGKKELGTSMTNNTMQCSSIQNFSISTTNTDTQ